jgi:MtN3 and saliva related transmembrane protein
VSGWIPNVVGGAAAIFSTASFVPQLVKIVRERDTSGVSTRMYFVTVVGFGLWSTYGLMQHQWPLIASNVTSLFLAGAILGFKLLGFKSHVGGRT